MADDYIKLEIYSGAPTIEFRRDSDGLIHCRVTPTHGDSQTTAPPEWQTLTRADIFDYAGRCNPASDWLIKIGVNPTTLLEESRREYSEVRKGTSEHLEIGRTYLAGLKAMINIKANYWSGEFTVLSNTTLDEQREVKKADDALIEDMKKRVAEITKELKAFGFESADDHHAA